MVHDDDIGGERMDDQQEAHDQQGRGSAAGVSPSQGSAGLIVAISRFSQLIFASDLLKFNASIARHLEAECPSAVRLLDEVRPLSETRPDEVDGEAIGEEDEPFGPIGLCGARSTPFPSCFDFGVRSGWE
jgi:hypothetical protein